MNVNIDIPREELSVILGHRADLFEHPTVKVHWNYMRQSGDREFTDCGLGMMKSRLCFQTNGLYQSSRNGDQHG